MSYKTIIISTATLTLAGCTLDQTDAPIAASLQESQVSDEPAAATAAEDAAVVGTAGRDIQISYPDKGKARRRVHVFGVDHGVTPYVSYTAKKCDLLFCSNECDIGEGTMYLLPATSVTVEICAGIGAVVDVVAGQVQGCISAERRYPEIWEFVYDSTNKELNYQVVLTQGDAIVGKSSWFPRNASNGCPRH